MELERVPENGGHAFFPLAVTVGTSCSEAGGAFGSYKGEGDESCGGKGES